MKLHEIRLGSKQHAELIAAAQKIDKTVGALKRKLKSEACTMPQVYIDELLDALDKVPNDKVLNHKDLTDLAFISGCDLDELEAMTSITEGVAPTFKKFKKGQCVTVKKTGEKVTVMHQNDIGLVQTASDDATKVPAGHKGGVFAKGYKEYMPSELDEAYEGNNAYRAWIKAVRKVWPDAQISGNEIRGQMVDWNTKNNEVAGDWNDKKGGVVYEPGSNGKKVVQTISE